MTYARDKAYREGVLMAMKALEAGNELQCWYCLLLVAPCRPEWLQTARLYYAIFGDEHRKSVNAWECLFFAVWAGELGPVPHLFTEGQPA